MQFTPQTVEADSWRAWLIEGLQLSGRRPLTFTILIILYAGLDYLPDEIGDLQFLLTPLFLGLGCITASSADQSKSIATTCAETPISVWGQLIALGVVPLMAALAFKMCAAPAPLPPVVFEGGLGILVVMFFWLLFAGPILWFFIPLAAIGRLPFLLAVEQGKNALLQNFFVYCLTMSLTLLIAAMVMMGASVASVPLYPVLCCVMYVSYRHIWFNRRQNEPEVRSGRSSILATS